MKLTYITLRGEQHPLCYNLYAIERMCDEFGGLEEMSAAVSSEKTGEQVRAVGKVLKILMDGGRAYCAEMAIDMPKPIANPAALIDVTSPETVQAIFSAIGGGKETEIEVASKNAATTQGK